MAEKICIVWPACPRQGKGASALGRSLSACRRVSEPLKRVLVHTEIYRERYQGLHRRYLYLNMRRPLIPLGTRVAYRALNEDDGREC